MSIANNIITLALNTAGVLGVGQTPQAQDVSDSLSTLNAMIYQWQYQRTVEVIPGTLPAFPDLTTDVPFWDSRESVLIWNLSVRLRPLFGEPEDEQQTKLAAAALSLLQANNRQQQPPPVAATNDTTAQGLVFLALRAAGRINDQQGVDPASQDVLDGLMILQEMWDEWQQDRAVTVTPGMLPVIPTSTTPLALTLGLRAATVWNLAVRMRSAFGLPADETQDKMAARALAAYQANNKQQVAPLHPGVPATAIQVIFLALRAAGRITDAQSVSDTSQDVSDGFAQLVMMLAQWSKERWLVFDEIDVSVTSTGAQSYTIGAGGDFALASRPDRLEAAFVRVTNGAAAGGGDFSSADFSSDDFLTDGYRPPGLSVDYQLDVLDSREDYNQIGFKALTSFPSCVFLDSGNPLGTVYVWPVPAAGQYEIHLTVKASLPSYAGLYDPLGLPAEYNEALVYNLAVRILTLNGGMPNQSLVGLARATLQTIRKANLQIPRLQMPSGLPGVRGSGAWGGFGFGGFSSASVVNGVTSGGSTSGGSTTLGLGLTDDSGASLTDDAGNALYADGSGGTTSSVTTGGLADDSGDMLTDVSGFALTAG